jgi:hypothetical protein
VEGNEIRRDESRVEADSIRRYEVVEGNRVARQECVESSETGGLHLLCVEGSQVDSSECSV